MPKFVDHDARRRAIADAVIELAATEGLPAVTLRRVAGQLGGSMGAVQYYFSSRDEMLDFAHGHLAARREQRVRARLEGLGRAPDQRDILYAAVLTGLPLDEDRRAEALADGAYFARGLTEAGAHQRHGLPQLLAMFEDLVRTGISDGLVREGVDPALEARVLWALIATQASALAHDVDSVEEALATVDYEMARIFIDPPTRVEQP
ncbi:TetR/AcrR family transcriptional regulator [Propionibacteriaceae bacterium Y2011]